MNLESIVTQLTANDCGYAGKSIFINEMPGSCESGILLLDGYSGTATDPYLDGYYVTEFRLITRSTDYAAGTALAKKASKALKTAAGWTATDMIVNRCWPMNLPRPYRRSVGAYWEFEVDVSIVFVDIGA